MESNVNFCEEQFIVENWQSLMSDMVADAVAETVEAGRNGQKTQVCQECPRDGGD